MTDIIPTVDNNQPWPCWLTLMAPPMHTAKNPRKSHVRRLKPWPALMRFFQRNATAAVPVGRSPNGGRFLLFILAAECQLPARTAATISARFRASASDASSKATSDLATQR